MVVCANSGRLDIQDADQNKLLTWNPETPTSNPGLPFNAETPIFILSLVNRYP